MDGGIRYWSENVPFTLTFQAFIPGIPGVPLIPGRPVRPRGPVIPRN